MEPLVHITLVVDKSGSMNASKTDVIGGFNAFLEAQRALPGHMTVTLVLFDTGYTTVHNGVPVAQVPDLDARTYQPGGCTALIDAVTRGIIDTERFLSGLPPQEQPVRVLFVVMTDGEENSSRLYDLNDLRTMVAEREGAGNWEFVYIGHALDGFSHGTQASSIGIHQSTTSDSVAESYREVTELTSVVRARVKRDAGLRWKGTRDDTN